MRRNVARSTVPIVLVLLVSACASSKPVASPSTSSTIASSATSSTIASTNASSTVSSITTPATSSSPNSAAGVGVDPNTPEVVAPGDIPDNQAFVAFTSADAHYSVKVPEGWARTTQADVVTFTDKYNSITIASAPTSSPTPSVVQVKASQLTDVSTDPTFRLIDVQPVARAAGDGVVATYEIGSAPNAVTGKKALLAVERYVFVHAGTAVVLTLSGAKGADNVDPWKTVSNSLTWLG